MPIIQMTMANMMIKNSLKQKGFSLFEVVIATAIFALGATMFTGAFIVATQSRAVAADRDQATFLAEEGLEAARAIRDTGFGNLATGTWGLAITAGHWTFSGSKDATGIFTRQITISSVNTTTDQVVSSVSWPSGRARTSTASLATDLISFATPTEAACLSVGTAGASIGSTGSTELLGITLGNPCAHGLTLSQIKISWATSTSSIKSVAVNGLGVWSGSAVSGSTLNITDVVIPSGTSAMPVNWFQFTKSMIGNTFTITFIMLDGSTSTVALAP